MKARTLVAGRNVRKAMRRLEGELLEDLHRHRSLRRTGCSWPPVRTHRQLTLLLEEGGPLRRCGATPRRYRSGVDHWRGQTTAELPTTQSAPAGDLPPVWWPVVGVIAALTVAFHLATAGIAGMHRDEFYYLAGGHHPSFGYVDHPPRGPDALPLERAPLRPFAARALVLPALIGGAFVVIAAVPGTRVRGRQFAQALAATMGALGPIFVTTSRFLSTVTLDVVAWSLPRCWCCGSSAPATFGSGSPWARWWARR